MGLGVGGVFSTYVVAIIISVAVSEFIGRCVESASGSKEKKVYNYKTHTYDSEKNGKLNKNPHTEDARIEDLKNANKVKNIKNKVKATQNRKKNDIKRGLYEKV